jgi:hypothetical protein
MRIFIIYLLITLVALILFNCKKYPEGGYQRRGPKLILGNWKLTLYEVNGIDSTELINYNGDDNYKQIVFINEQTKYNPHLYVNVDNANQKKIGFTNSNKYLNISYDHSSKIGATCALDYYNKNKCYRLFFCPEGESTEWKIMKLTKKEFHLTYQLKNNYNLKFTK